MATDSRITAARAALAKIEAERARIEARQVKNAAERDAVAYGAMTDDKPARKALDGLNGEASAIERELKTADAAVAEAKRRITAAEEAVAADELAAAGRTGEAIAAEIDRLAAEADAAAIVYRTALAGMLDQIEAAARLPMRGPPVVRSAQLAAGRAMVTHFHGLPLAGVDFPHLAPNQRATHAQLAGRVAQGIRDWAATVLGRKVPQEAA